MLKILDSTNRTVIVKMDKLLFAKIRLMGKDLLTPEDFSISPHKSAILQRARRSAARSKKSFTSAKDLIDDILNS